MFITSVTKSVKQSICIVLPLALCFLCTCSETITREPATFANGAFFIDGSTVGVIITHYIKETYLHTLDEHVMEVEYKQHLYHYSVASGTLVDKGILDTLHPMESWAVGSAGNVLVLDYGQYGRSVFPYFDLNGSRQGLLGPAEGIASAHPVAISPNGRFFLFWAYSANYSGVSYRVFDRIANTYGPITNSSSQYFYGLTDDGQNGIVLLSSYNERSIATTLLARKNMNSGAIDTLADIRRMDHVWKSSPKWLLFKDSTGTAGYFTIDTTATPRARFISLGVRAWVIDIDTTQGNYLVCDTGEVMLGNYRTGTAARKIAP